MSELGHERHRETQYQAGSEKGAMAKVVLTRGTRAILGYPTQKRVSVR
jgi:hypothetical protein